MRLVDFLICLLEAHAQTLQRLAALFGEELLLHMLEESGERIAAETVPSRFDATWFQAPRGSGFSSPYAELESAVSGTGLAAVLEFHLWAYPYYRHFIESDTALDARIPEDGSALVDEAIEQADAWVKRLPIAAEFAPRARSAAHVPWLRFRTQVLKRIGKRPIGPVT